MRAHKANKMQHGELEAVEPKASLSFTCILYKKTVFKLVFTTILCEKIHVNHMVIYNLCVVYYYFHIKLSHIMDTIYIYI